jgi:hypothetical protein
MTKRKGNWTNCPTVQIVATVDLKERLKNAAIALKSRSVSELGNRILREWLEENGY